MESIEFRISILRGAGAGADREREDAVGYGQRIGRVLRVGDQLLEAARVRAHKAAQHAGDEVLKVGKVAREGDLRADGGARPPRRRPGLVEGCLLYTSPSPRDRQKSRMPSSA